MDLQEKDTKTVSGSLKKCASMKIQGKSTENPSNLAQVIKKPDQTKGKTIRISQQTAKSFKPKNFLNKKGDKEK